jgi:hypothetical protein
MAKLSKRLRKFFARERKTAAALVEGPAAAIETVDLVDRALIKASALGRSTRLRAALDDVKTLGRLARAWARRD